MKRRDFLVFAPFFTLGVSYGESFSLNQIKKKSIGSTDNITRYRVNSFIKQRLPKIIVKNRKVNTFLTKIAEPLFNTSNKKINWKIFVVDENQVNAYTLGGGLILVDIKLIKACENETQLASVIAHEMGHVIHKHCEKRMVQNKLYNQFEVKGYRNTDIRLLYKSYSRIAEHEADAFIIKAFLETNYSIKEASSFFHILKKIHPDTRSAYQCLFSTHPRVEKRINKLDKIASTYSQMYYKSEDSKEFLYLKNWSKT